MCLLKQTNATSAPSHFARDAQTWLAYGQLSVVAFLIDGYAPTVPLLGTDLGISDSLAAVHGTVLGLGFLISGLISDRFSQRFGRTATTWLGLLILAAGASAYALFTHLTLTLTGIGLCGFSGAMIQSMGCANLSQRHGHWGPRALNEGAAISQGAGLVAPAIIGLAAASRFGWRAGIFFLAFTSITLACFYVTRGARYNAAGSSRQSSKKVSQGHLSLRFWGMWASYVMLLGIEFSLTMWTPLFLMSKFDLPRDIAVATPSIMLTGIMIGRFIVASLISPKNQDILLYCTIILAVAGFAIFWLSNNVIVVIGILLVIGFGISGHYPISVARLIHESCGRDDSATARAATGFGLALAAAPITLGALSDYVGVRLGLLFVPLLALLSALLVLINPTRTRPYSYGKKISE